ncbi:MAG: transcriptional regulator, partial [Clostridium sp.]|nr:transcriptional regulator [Clostridium sp.]
MATSIEFIEYVCEQVSGIGIVRYRKMFGEYMVYINDKPILLVCDNTVFVKELECI